MGRSKARLDEAPDDGTLAAVGGRNGRGRGQGLQDSGDMQGGQQGRGGMEQKLLPFQLKARGRSDAVHDIFGQPLYLFLN